MLTNLFIFAASIATPYTDAQERFSLDLPPCWERGPLPAGEEGASFRCTMGAKLALAAVRVIPAGTAKNAAAVARQLGKVLEELPGYRLVEEGSAEMGGRPAARRRCVVFVDGKAEMVKTVEDRVVVAKGTAYVLRVESLDSSFFDFEPDFAHLVKSFALGPTPNKLAAKKKSRLVGRWLMKGTKDTFLELRNDGTFDLAGTTGTYKVQGKALLMWMAGGMEEFKWRLHRGDLVLSSPNLGEPIRYKKAK